MYKGIPYSNKIVKRREQQRLQSIHKQNLRNIRPLTTNIDLPFEAVVANPLVNNKKKDMLQEDRFTEIERENRMLLQKIHTIMSKKPAFKPERMKRNNSIATNAKMDEKQRMNKSLNQVYRRKQLEDIEIENAKLLKRIMDKKSDYDNKKLKEEWKWQKTVIKNIANYPFIIRDKIYKGRKKSMTSQSFNHTFVNHPYQQSNTLSSPIQLVRIRNLSGQNFLITVKYDGNVLQILGDNKSTKEIKIIEIPKEEGLEFIQYECDGKIQLIFQCLRYDPVEKILYLVGKDVELGNGKADDKEDVENQEDQMEALEKKQKDLIQQIPSQQISQNEQLLGSQKGLKKRQMSNIYEIQNSQIQTQPNRILQNNPNLTNLEQQSQIQNLDLVQGQNMAQNQQQKAQLENHEATQENNENNEEIQIRQPEKIQGGELSKQAQIIISSQTDENHENVNQLPINSADIIDTKE